MSYREKTAWLSLIAIALTFGPYFISVAMGLVPAEALPNFRQLGAYAATALGQVVILGIGHMYLRYTSREEARVPADERDKAIVHSAMTAGYYVLLTGMILVGVVMPFTSNGWSIINSALFMIIVAEVVRYGVIVSSYRRQA